jgi:hypothetical protein
MASGGFTGPSRTSDASTYRVTALTIGCLGASPSTDRKGPLAPLIYAPTDNGISIAARLRYFTALLSAVGLRLIGWMLPAGSNGKLGGFAGGLSPGARKQRAPITRTSDLCMRMFPDSSQ